MGSLLVASSRTWDTSGNPGFAASTTPPKLSSSEKSPTSARSFCTAFCVACLLAAPVKPSSALFSTSLRPFTPPVELT